jgi:hypothetical protein
VRTRSVLIATTLVSSLLVTACGTENASDAGGGTLPILRIGAGSSAAVAASADLAGYESKAGYGGYRIAGTLPSGPSHASTYLTRHAMRADVVRVAAALGINGTPVRHQHGWVVATSAGRLAVADSGEWAFQDASSTCPRFFVDVDSSDGSTGVACAAPGAVPAPGLAAPSATTKVAPALPSAATLRTVARPLLAALGLPPTRGIVQGFDQVSVDPEVDGFPTSGYQTDVVVDGHRVTAADGWVYPARPAAGPTYPLISASAALKLMAIAPEPMMAQPAIACPDVARVPAPSATSAADSPTAMPCGGPTIVTGGRLGLALEWDGGYRGTAILVPAWFLTLRGGGGPLVLVAVSPKYVAPPAPPTTLSNPAGSVGGAPGSTGSGGVSTEPSVGPSTSTSPGTPSGAG